MESDEMPLRPSILFLAVLCCAGCDQLGFDSPKKIASEGNAIGAACRHAGRALEDCYQLNPQASKSAIFAGWKEMNDYMTEQKIDVVRPVLPPVLPKSLRPKKPAASESGDAGNSEATPENAAASAP